MKRNSKNITFDVYRYQILPISKLIQTSLFDQNILTEEELLQQKNFFFQKAIEENKQFLEGRKIQYLFKVLAINKNSILVKLAIQRNLNIDKKDFTEETIETFPNIFVLFDNNPEVQEIFIEKNYKAFNNTADVVTILERNINKNLKKYNLKVYIQPIFDKKEFWALAHQYEGRITRIIFDLIRPNMANISGVLSEDMKQLQKSTNSHRTKLELNASHDSVLENISESNLQISSMVNYSSEGGGDITLKAKGVKSKIKTNKSVNQFSFDELMIKGKDANEIIQIIKSFKDQ